MFSPESAGSTSHRLSVFFSSTFTLGVVGCGVVGLSGGDEGGGGNRHQIGAQVQDEKRVRVSGGTSHPLRILYRAIRPRRGPDKQEPLDWKQLCGIRKVCTPGRGSGTQASVCVRAHWCLPLHMSVCVFKTVVSPCLFFCFFCELLFREVVFWFVLVLV